VDRDDGQLQRDAVERRVEELGGLSATREYARAISGLFRMGLVPGGQITREWRKRLMAPK
jgi:hypothetical protein